MVRIGCLKQLNYLHTVVIGSAVCFVKQTCLSLFSAYIGIVYVVVKEKNTNIHIYINFFFGFQITKPSIYWCQSVGRFTGGSFLICVCRCENYLGPITGRKTIMSQTLGSAWSQDLFHWISTFPVAAECTKAFFFSFLQRMQPGF